VADFIPSNCLHGARTEVGYTHVTQFVATDSSGASSCSIPIHRHLTMTSPAGAVRREKRNGCLCLFAHIHRKKYIHHHHQQQPEAAVCACVRNSK
jgi:hypothetical protein